MKKTSLEDIATEITKTVSSYYDTWHKPIKYRDLIPRFGPRLEQGVTITDLVDYLTLNKCCLFLMSPRGKQYVFPYTDFELAPEIEDQLLETLVELDRAALIEARASARARKGYLPK